MNPIAFRLVIIIILANAILISCDSKNNDGIPSYIHIESIGLTTVTGQGTASHKITDAWVYIDNKLEGAYELPATFPVLKQGGQQVTIYAGIKINGITATRSAYPFFKPIVTNLTLIPGKVATVMDTIVQYNENYSFRWMEDFNSGSVTIDTTSNSETSLSLVSDHNLVFKYRNELNQYSAMATLTGDTMLFECVTINSYELPGDGAPVFLEMNYKNDHIMTVGLIFSFQGEHIQQPVLVLNPSDAWNKIYVNLTPTIINFHGSDNFRIFIGMLRPPETESAIIFLDHLKLIY